MQEKRTVAFVQYGSEYSSIAKQHLASLGIENPIISVYPNTWTGLVYTLCDNLQGSLGEPPVDVSDCNIIVYTSDNDAAQKIGSVLELPMQTHAAVYYINDVDTAEVSLVDWYATGRMPLAQQEFTGLYILVRPESNEYQEGELQALLWANSQFGYSINMNDYPAVRIPDTTVNVEENYGLTLLLESMSMRQVRVIILYPGHDNKEKAIAFAKSIRDRSGFYTVTFTVDTVENAESNFVE